MKVKQIMQIEANRKETEEIYQNIQKKVNLRENLSRLKQLVRNQEGKKMLEDTAAGNYDCIMKCLSDEDPKVRKNAAAVLGELHCQQALDVLFDAYDTEEKRFVRPAYLQAMANMDCKEYLEYFRKRKQQLEEYQPAENEKKHIEEEIHALQELLLKKEGMPVHKFTGYHVRNEVILQTLPAFLPAVAAQIPERHQVMSGGVRVVTQNLDLLEEIRPVREMLFLTKCRKSVPESEITGALRDAGLLEFLTERHKGQEPFYFRLQIVSRMPLDKRSAFAHRLARQIEEESDRKLVNSTTHYEVEIRLIQQKNRNWFPLLKLFTIPDQKFQYRRHYVAASMKPYIAAGLLELARPYLKENAQVLDPFCGVGTFLIERQYLMPVRSSYGIDTFGEAIEKARENSHIAGMPINYINRDFRDFSHEYLFDEVLADMPEDDRMNGREKNDLYRDFLLKCDECLKDGGVILCYSGEMGVLKTQLRLHPQFHLCREFEILPKSGKYLYIITK